MRDVTGQNFGYLIAYVLPGLVLLGAVDQIWPGTQPWLEQESVGRDSPSVGGFLYLSLASVAAGLVASTVRWLLIDRLHHRTGIRPPKWDDSRLQEHLGAFEALVAAHYRYYQFYANSIVSITALVSARAVCGTWSGQDGALAVVGALFWAGSRDTLRRYYRRTEHLLNTISKGKSDDERAQSGPVDRQSGQGAECASDGMPQSRCADRPRDSRQEPCRRQRQARGHAP